MDDMTDDLPKRPEKSLIDKVRTWLTKEGYPFELEVGRQLREAGIHDLEHGHPYLDLRSGKWREIDILGTRFIVSPEEPERTQPPLFKLRFVVECKYAKRPWLVLASPSSQIERQFPSGYLLGAVGSAIVRRAEMPNLDGQGASGTGVSLKAFGLGATRGHGVVEAFAPRRGRPSASHRALRGVVAAAGADAAGIDASQLSARISPAKPRIHVVFLHLPVIVVKGSIFELSLDRHGRESLSEVEEAAVLTPGPYGRAGSTLVRLVKPGGPLRTLVEHAAADARLLTDILRPNWAEHLRLAHLPEGDSPGQG